jgi:hypothetical protein
MGRGSGFVVSHPSDKNKNVARMGHPKFEVENRNHTVAILGRGLGGVGDEHGFQNLVGDFTDGGR